jgi:hypothetical protein
MIEVELLGETSKMPDHFLLLFDSSSFVKEDLGVSQV